MPEHTPLGDAVPVEPAAVDTRAVRDVVEHHRRRLMERAEQWSHDPAFIAEASWGLYALERIDRALRGITDRQLLGLNDEPRRPPPMPTTTSRTTSS